MTLRPNGFRSDAPRGGHHHDRALSDDDLSTDRQRDRRTRILDAAVDTAGAGGYDLVHMRDIAVRAPVSVATLYHYFPSKVHVLVWALERELTHFDEHLSEEFSTIADPFCRLRVAVGRLTDAMQESDRATEALTHAYVAFSVVAPAEAEMIRLQTSEMFAHLMSAGSATDLHRHTADVLTDVWASEVLALVQGEEPTLTLRYRNVATTRSRGSVSSVSGTVIDDICRQNVSATRWSFDAKYVQTGIHRLRPCGPIEIRSDHSRRGSRIPRQR